MIHKPKNESEHSELRDEAEKRYNENHRSLTGDFEGLSEQTELDFVLHHDRGQLLLEFEGGDGIHKKSLG